jgi:hypothetical protein
MSCGGNSMRNGENIEEKGGETKDKREIESNR